MENHPVLLSTLNELCKREIITSWTCHKNKRGYLLSIRFYEEGAILDFPDNASSETIHYKPKSISQVKRDESRMSRFISKFPTSVQGQFNGIDSSFSNVIVQSQPIETVPSTQEIEAMHQPFHMDRNSQATSHKQSTYASQVNDQPNSADDESESQAIFSVGESAVQDLHCLEPELSEKYSPERQTDIGQAMELVSLTTQEPKNHVASDSICYSSEHFQFMESTPKYLVNDELLCDVCCAVAPCGTKMMFCDNCLLHVCGSCVTDVTFTHSQNCTNDLRIMMDNEKHLQRVPNESMDSEITRPPDIKDDTSTDQLVPDQPLSFMNNSVANFFANQIDQRLRRAFRDSFADSPVRLS